MMTAGSCPSLSALRIQTSQKGKVMATTGIEAELQKVTGVKPKSKEERNGASGYLERLTLAASNDIKDEEWEELSEGAQKWVNDNVAVYKGKTDEKDYSDFASDNDKGTGRAKARSNGKAKDEDEDKPRRGAARKSKDEEEDEKPARGKKAAAEDEDEKPKGRGTKAKDDKPAKKAAGRSSGGGGDGMKVRIKKLLLKDPDMSAGDLYDKLDSEGDAPSRMTCNGIRAEFRHSLKVMKEAGYTDAKGKPINI